MAINIAARKLELWREHWVKNFTGLARRVGGVAAVMAAIALLGCAAAPSGPATAQSAAETDAERDARCMVTGSMLPKRDCRAQVQTVSPAALDGARPPSNVPRN
jgi:hypothetical protein